MTIFHVRNGVSDIEVRPLDFPAMKSTAESLFLTLDFQPTGLPGRYACYLLESQFEAFRSLYESRRESRLLKRREIKARQQALQGEFNFPDAPGTYAQPCAM